MRSAGNFHPEWGYFAPMAGFRRNLHVAAIAIAIGATAGAMVVVALVSPPRSTISNTSFSGQALINRTQLVASPVNALTMTTAAADHTVLAAQASLHPVGSIDQVATPSTKLPTAAVNAEPDMIAATKSPARTHRSRVAGTAQHPRYEREFTRSFRLPINSRLVQLDRSCCAWTSPPTRRNPLGW